MKIEIRTIESGGHLKAFADVEYMGFIMRGFTIMQGKDGVFACAPRRLGRDGRWNDVIEFTDHELKQSIFAAVMAEYEKVVAV